MTDNKPKKPYILKKGESFLHDEPGKEIVVSFSREGEIVIAIRGKHPAYFNSWARALKHIRNNERQKMSEYCYGLMEKLVIVEKASDELIVRLAEKFLNHV